jgi:hypothetical protein
MPVSPFFNCRIKVRLRLHVGLTLMQAASWHLRLGLRTRDVAAVVAPPPVEGVAGVADNVDGPVRVMVKKDWAEAGAGANRKSADPIHMMKAKRNARTELICLAFLEDSKSAFWPA